MDTSIEEDQENSLKFIRKLRKKLRQIERLEKSQRELTDEEKIKLSCKHDIRSKLQSILSTINEANISVESHTSVPDPAEFSDKSAGESGDTDHQEREIPETRPPYAEREIPGPRNSGEAFDSEKDKAQIIPEVKSTVKVEKSDIKKGKKVQNIRSTLRKFWRNSCFFVTELNGHNDTVNCVDALANWIVSGSRDTTVKLWDASSGKEIKSMGGHSSQVTAVKILPISDSDALRKCIDQSTVEVFADISERFDENENIVISGSTDCCIRLWLIPRGLFMKSIYNYNPVSALEYYSEKKLVLIGSHSGNLTVYDVCTSAQVYSSTIHSGQITEIKIADGKVITSSTDGSIKIWTVGQEPTSIATEVKEKRRKLEFDVKSEDFDINLQYSFEDHDSYLSERYIHTILSRHNDIYFGDDGVNIKIWNIETDGISKLRNHKPTTPGITDCMSGNDVILFSTSYDLDSGRGSVNVRSLHQECYGAYLATFTAEDIPRLTTFQTQFKNGQKYFVTGGEKLLLWKFHDAEKPRPVDAEGCTIVRGQNVTDLGKPATDSDVHSDDDDTTDGESESRWFWQRSKPKPEKTDSPEASDSDVDSEDSRRWKDESSLDKSSSFSLWDWCTLL